jgi:hypothetical protein
MQTEGAILWFDPSSGTGAVQTDGGRHFRFHGTLPFNPRVGRKVLVDLNPEGTTVRDQVRVGPLPQGRHTTVDIEEVTVEYALAVKGLPTVSRPRGVEAPVPERSVAKPTGGPKRRGPRNKFPTKRPGEAFFRGQSVRHASYGHGFVQMSSERMARVQFGIVERQVRVSELEAD